MRPLVLALSAVFLLPTASAQTSCLSGDCENGQGRARYVLADGNHVFFEGRFLRGEPIGEGRVIQSNGWTYEGQFDGFVLDGVYLATHENGQQERVLFDDNQFIEVVERIRTAGGASATDTNRGLQVGSTVEDRIAGTEAAVSLLAAGGNRPADVFTLLLTPGQTARIRLESRDFDPYLLIHRDGASPVRNDDFEGSRSVSQLDVTAYGSSNTTYTVYVGPFSENGTGRYTLTVSGVGSASRPAGFESFRSVMYCALDGTALREFEGRYDPSAGVYYALDGRRVSDMGQYEPWVRAMGRYGEGAAWYINNDPIEVGSATYVKYGLPRVLGVTDVAFLAEAGGAAVFAEEGVPGAPEVVYVAVRPGCEFQPYQREVMAAAENDEVAAVPTLTVGAPLASGSISSSDALVALTAGDDLRRADAYALSLGAGQRATVRMESSAFDTYLKVMREGAFVVRNDDFGTTSVSQVEITAPTAGTYTVYAGSFTEAGVGAYTIRATMSGPASGVRAATDSGAPVSTASGGNAETVVEGTLTDDDMTHPMTLADDLRKTDMYLIAAGPGQRIVVEMTSDDFDTYLRLERNGVKVDHNDDAGSTSRSAIEATAELGGVYMLYAGTFSESGRGAYTLRYRVE